MHPLRRRRLRIVLFIVAGASVAAGLVFWALRDNMNFFYAPAQVAAGQAPEGRSIRIGGLVVPGSLHRSASGLEVEFMVTDNRASVPVSYTGILPDLFAEGQGVVALGRLEAGNRFRAEQVLAKHDENYIPPEVHEALKAGGAPEHGPQGKLRRAG